MYFRIFNILNWIASKQTMFSSKQANKQTEINKDIFGEMGGGVMNEWNK